jgi:hypothetical protein
MSFLSDVGKFFKGVLHIGTEVAEIATPVLSIVDPSVVPIYTSALNLAVGAESLMDSTTGTGEQKLKTVTSALLPQVQSWATKNGINWPEADVQKWVSAVVDTIDMIPSVSSASATPPVHRPALAATVRAVPKVDVMTSSEKPSSYATESNVSTTTGLVQSNSLPPSEQGALNVPLPAHVQAAVDLAAATAKAQEASKPKD